MRRRFAHLRLRKEWFSFDPDMLVVTPPAPEVRTWESKYAERGGAIAEYLDQNGITRSEFASRVGVNPEAVRLWEFGLRKPAVRFFKKIEAATGGQLNRRDFRPDIYAE